MPNRLSASRSVQYAAAGLHIYASLSCTGNARFCRGQGVRQIALTSTVASTAFPRRRLVRRFTSRFRRNVRSCRVPDLSG
jgi:hypothetical protein